jgi:hypothetical protein
MPVDGKLQKLHAPIDIEIVQLLLSIIPEKWWSVRLDVEYVASAPGEEGYPMTITNNEGERDSVMPPEALFQLVRRHSLVFQEHGKQWKKLVYNVTYDREQEDWQYAIDYGY